MAKEKGEFVGKSLANLSGIEVAPAARQAETSVTAETPRVKKKLLGLQFPTAEAARAFSQDIKEAQEQISLYVEKIGVVLRALRREKSGPEHWENLPIDSKVLMIGTKWSDPNLFISFLEKEVGECIDGVTEGLGQDTLRSVYLEAMLKNYTCAELPRIIEQGRKVGAVAEAGSPHFDTNDREVEVVMRNGDGVWRKHAFTVQSVPNATLLVGDLRKLAEENRRAYEDAVRNEEERFISDFGEGIDKRPFREIVRDVLTSRNGRSTKVIVDVPAEPSLNNVLPSSRSLVCANIRGVMLEVVQATGPCSGLISRIAKNGDILPLEALKEGWIRLEERIPENRFNDLRALLKIMSGVIAEEEAGRRTLWEKAKTNTTVNRSAFILGNVSGSCHLLLTPDMLYPLQRKRVQWAWEWKRETGGKKETLRFSVVSFIVERNETKQMRVAAFSPNIPAEFFASCTEFADPGEKFSGLAYPLAQLMRTFWTIYNQKAKRTHKSDSSGTTAKPGTQNDSVETKAHNVAEETASTEAA